MNIIHTADWHLGNTFHGYSRLEEHRHFLEWLLGVLRARRPDVLLVTGDVFDSANPSAAAERLYYNFLMQAVQAVKGLQVVVTAGNHDSPGRLEATAELLRAFNIYVRGYVHHDPETDEPDVDSLLLPLSSRLSPEAQVVCFALPFLRPGDYPGGLSVQEGIAWYLERLTRRLRKSDFKGLPVIVAAHFYAAGAEVCAGEHSERLVVGGQDCVDARAVACGAAYTALGHLHKAQQVGQGAAALHYAGSALPMSFSEKGYHHGVTAVEIDEKGHASASRIAYTPQRPLVSIPERGAAAPADILAACAALPPRDEAADEPAWPYLEIRVEERQPEPELLHKVTACLSDRAVRLCRMVRETPDRPETGAEDNPPQSLRKLEPADVARRFFENRYHAAMPDGLAARFERAAREAADESAGTPEELSPKSDRQ